MPQLQRALGLHQSGRNGEAWLIVGPLRQAVNQDGQALRLYALIAQAVGRIDEAIAAMKRIAAMEGQPADIMGRPARGGIRALDRDACKASERSRSAPQSSHCCDPRRHA
jgi:hypothetical protein